MVAPAVDTGFTLPLFPLGAGGIVVLLMSDKVHKRGRHCGACAVMVVGILCQDGLTKASELCRERQELPLQVIDGLFSRDRWMELKPNCILQRLEKLFGDR